MTDSEMEKQIRRPMVRSTWCSSVKEKTPGSVKEKTAALLHRAVRHKCTPMAQSRMALLAAALLLLPANVAADMYDVVMPAYLPPAGCAACRAWDATVDAALWADPLKALAGAKSHYAMPAANLTGHDKTTPEGSYGGPWCYCKATGGAVSCVPPKARPAQHPFRALVCAAPTLNASGQPGSRYGCGKGRLRAAAGHGRGSGGLKSVQKRWLQAR